MLVLQRTMLSVEDHSFLTEFVLNSFMSWRSADSGMSADYLAQLLDIWDYAVFLFSTSPSPTINGTAQDNVDTSVAPSTSTAVCDARTISLDRVWSDVGRGALAACLVIGLL
ncbi:hypothetical protein CMQ_7707 [Grosmannia clavigera kw1407]|uniref:Uncharacterized protein n=1 Tax=Grosmannia clavigera (strain kw1407 / UAMH 11150) TaxID=655863 RepID=F0XQC3_GROCL|nr:uncharacterized protein CMQ_7707 [Grosmannia clavigera kw1407]EFX00705.1 hypothetical protein CMQ_7707 [Grosmannia clavigera kw1407]